MKTKSFFAQKSSSPVYSSPCSFTIHHHILFSLSLLFTNLLGLPLPCFFLLTSLQMYYLYFSPLCSLCFLFISLHSAAHEMSSLTYCWYLDITSGINMILLSRKNPETQKSDSSVGKGLIIIIITKPTKEKKNLRISRESDFDSPRDHSLQPSVEKILGRSSYYQKF